MTPAVTPTPAAPPADPVQTALSDAAVQQGLRRHAHVILGRWLADRPASVRSEAVADAVQETQLRALQKRTTYDPAHSVRAWLHGIMTNVLRETARSNHKLPAQEAADPAVWEQLAVDVASLSTEAEADRLTITEILSRLPAEQQQMVRLRFYDRLSHEEIAARLGITAGNARVRLYRAIAAAQAIAGVGPKEERS
jgi:RNA polymerase sigma-70 factor (ECF subfamily)